jgi:membrane protein YqaA with SNARE-associated domain
LLDSSFLSLLDIHVLLLFCRVTRPKGRIVLYVLGSTLGSIAGCFVLYYLGRKGGDAVVRRRFGHERVERALAAVRRRGMMAVLIPSLLPPPAPFKIFVLLAGAAGITASRFALAIGIGRGIRYLGEGLLAVRYGDQATAYLEGNLRNVSLAVIGLLILGVAGSALWSRARRGKSL